MKSIPILTLFAGCLLLASCASGPAAPEKGTPAFYWQAAKETFAAGDYSKTADHLERIIKTQNEFTPKAQPWRLVLTSGLSRGYAELADDYEQGGRANKTNPTPFRRQVSDYRAQAAQIALAFAETYETFEKLNKDQQVSLAFPFPVATATEPPQISRLTRGVLLQEADMDDVQKKVLARAVVLTATRAAGAAGDVAKAQEMFKSGDAKVPRDVFVLAMANALYDQSQLFTVTKLDQPQRLKFFCDHALEAVKTVPPSKDTKDVMAKIQAALKKAK